MNNDEINAFLRKFYDGCHTEQEHAQFIDWISIAPIEQVKEILDSYLLISARLSSNKKTEQHPEPGLVDKIEARLDNLNDCETPLVSEPAIKLYPGLIMRIASIAAIIFIVIILGMQFWPLRSSDKMAALKSEIMANEMQEIGPGDNKAVLILTNGSRITLDDIGNGTLTTQAGTNIRKTADGQISYDASLSSNQTSSLLYNTIITPRGGQYQIILPDGTKVWLNAESTLKFPVSFSADERRVELTGEAYFEVAKVSFSSGKSKTGRRVPFIVISGDQKLEVLGTHFNISAYPDEKTINTTLLEGSVKIIKPASHESLLLKPGQQSNVGTTIQISDVDVSPVIAWKNGYFEFSYEKIESVMRKISRWYNVEIIYEGDITQEEFVGSISRFEKVSQVLEMLELTGSIHFKIEGNGQEERRIIVMP